MSAGLAVLVSALMSCAVVLLVFAVVEGRRELQRRAQVRRADVDLEGRDERRIPARHRLADRTPHEVGQQPSAATGGASPLPVAAAVHGRRAS